MKTGGDFFIPPQSHLTAGDSPVSPPSAGRSGGGRVEKPRISPVHSLGLCGLPAGGVGERMARPVRRFMEAEILSGGGAPRSAATDLPPPGCSRLRRAVLCLFPVPELVVRRIRVDDFDGEGDGVQIEGDDDDARWRLF